MKSRFKAIFIVAFFLCTSDCLAGEKAYPVINWEVMGLTQAQKTKMLELDQKWQRVHNNLSLRIINNKQKLRVLLLSPYTTDAEIRELQGLILKDKKMLKYQSMEIFLEKRSILSPEQKKSLSEIFIQ